MTSPESRSRFKYLLASAVLMTLSQPPFPTGWLAYIALVPFLIGIEGLSGRKAFAWGIVWAVMVNSLGLYWIAWGNTAGFFGALVYLGLIDGLFVWLMCRVKRERRGLMLPFLWTGFIYIKSLGEMGFPWLTLALTQTYTPAAIQGAAVVGAWGVDLWVAAINSLVYKGLRRLSEGSRERSFKVFARSFAPALLLALAVLIYGRVVLTVGKAGESESFSALYAGDERGEKPPWIDEGTEPVDFAVIQGSVRPEVKLAQQMFTYNTYVYSRLTKGAQSIAGDGLDLVVWPETAVVGRLNISLRGQRFVRGLQAETGLPIVTGAFATFYDERPYRTYNSAFMVTANGISQGDDIYHKRLLVPFGERVPYQKIFGFMRDWTMGWSDFSMGLGAPLLGGTEDTPGIPPIGMLICYESVFSRLVKPEVVDGAQVLSVITNDAWFGRTTGPYQHLMMAALRAVEFRRPVIRAANSGVSALIDRWGRVYHATRLYTKDAVIGRAWPEKGFTLYARTGDWLPLAAIVAGVIGIFLFWEPKSKPAVSNPQKG